MNDWPPPAQDARYFLHGKQRLANDQPADVSLPDRYIYDPGNPTPAYGGPLLSFNGGPHDQRALESRSDVLTYTTDPLTRRDRSDRTPRVELYVRSSASTPILWRAYATCSPTADRSICATASCGCSPGQGERSPTDR